MQLLGRFSKRNGQEDQTASVCRDMAIFRFFKDGGHPYLGLFKSEIFNGRTA